MTHQAARDLKRLSWTCFVCLLGIALLQACATSKKSDETTPAPAGKSAKARTPRGADSLQAKARALENKVRRLEASRDHLYPSGPIILVDTARSHLSLVAGSRVIAEGTCSTGNGMELNDGSGKRSWTFDTPRGYFRVLSKVTDPVWYRPDWSYIEEGEPIPKNRASRAEANTLGDYALAFGNGFFIHGTLYTRLLGANVTHGCIRIDDDLLKKVYATAQPGTPIWIY
ncbi:MAG TPA: L,D-transpeptidase [Acidobacteriota bacterium]|nr:L,D-transpeptidase [Acidobacteriota bacterium]